MSRDIVLFYYYSSPSLPEECYLNPNQNLAHRNMFLLVSANEKMHFEFPIFENHSYNTICCREGLRSLIKRPSNHEKYIIFRTRNHETKNCNIIGYYKVKKPYYQETKLYNNNGFVWGIESDEVHLIGKGEYEYTDEIFKQGYRTSWNTEKWNRILNTMIDNIKKFDNISSEYKEDTQKISNIIRNQKEIDKWREYCKECDQNSCCRLYKKYSMMKKNKNVDFFDYLHYIYNSDLYSKNVLKDIKKIYLRGGDENGY